MLEVFGSFSLLLDVVLVLGTVLVITDEPSLLSVTELSAMVLVVMFTSGMESPSKSMPQAVDDNIASDSVNAVKISLNVFFIFSP